MDLLTKLPSQENYEDTSVQTFSLFKGYSKRLRLRFGSEYADGTYSWVVVAKRGNIDNFEDTEVINTTGTITASEQIITLPAGVTQNLEVGEYVVDIMVVKDGFVLLYGRYDVRCLKPNYDSGVASVTPDSLVSNGQLVYKSSNGVVTGIASASGTPFGGGNKPVDVAYLQDKIRMSSGLYYSTGANPQGSDITDFVDDFEGFTNAKYDTISIYEGLNSASPANYVNDVVPILNNTTKRVLWVLEPFGGNLDTLISQLNAESGTFYTNLLNTFKAIKAGGNDDRVYLAMFHECNGSGGAYSWQSWDTANSNTPAKQITAYRLCIDLARSLGLNAKFVQWFLEFNSSAGGQTSYASQYVGDDYIDVIGLTSYNRYFSATSPSTSWKVPLSTAKPAYDQIISFSSKPIWVCETSSTPGGQLEAITIANGGSGGTNGTYALTFSYSGGTPADTTLPTGTVTVSGGAITSVSITTRGKRNTSLLTIGYTVTGLTGASLTYRLTPSTRGQWLQNLFEYAREFYPRIESITLFADYNNSNEWGNFTTEEFGIIGEGVRSLKYRQNNTRYNDKGVNLLKEYTPTATTQFAVTGSGATMQLSDDVPSHFPVGSKSVLLTRPSGTGSSAANNEFYELFTSGTTPTVASIWEVGKPYTVSFWAKASVYDYKMSYGARENGGSNTRLVQERVGLSTSWKQYHYTFSNALSMSGGIKLFNLMFGENTTAGNIWVTGMKVEKGERVTTTI